MNIVLLLLAIYLIILIIFLVLKKDSFIVFYLGIILNWAVMSGNTLNPDYHTYLQAYKLIGSEIIINDVGWNFLMKIFNDFGFDYNYFLMIIIAFSMIIFSYSINRLTDNRLLFLLLYMICFMVIDTVQIRNFVSFSIVLFAMVMFMKNKEYSNAIYVILILIASSIHITSLFFLCVLLMKNKYIQTNKYLVFPVLLLVVFLQVNPSIRNQLVIVFSFFGKEYNNVVIGFGYLYILVINILCYFTILFASNQMNIQSSSTKRFAYLCNNLTAFSFLLIPLCMINMNVFRIIRYIQVIDLLFISSKNFNIFKNNYKIMNKSNFFLRLGIFFNCFFLFVFIYFIFGTYEAIIQPVIENNIFFGG